MSNSAIAAENRESQHIDDQGQHIDDQPASRCCGHPDRLHARPGKDGRWCSACAKFCGADPKLDSPQDIVPPTPADWQSVTVQRWMRIGDHVFSIESVDHLCPAFGRSDSEVRVLFRSGQSVRIPTADPQKVIQQFLEQLACSKS